jgi:uncharacterized membrane protein
VAINCVFFAVLAASVWIGETIVQLCLGAVFALICPGYALVSWIYPDAGEFEPFERLALVAVFSMSTLILVGIALSLSPWSIRAAPAMASIEFAVAVFSVGAFMRRRSLGLTAPQLWTARVAARQPRLLLAGAVVLAGILASHAAESTRHDALTEFFVLPAGAAGGVFVRSPGDSHDIRVTLGLVSRESHATTFTIRVVAGSAQLLRVDGIALSPGQTWTRRLRFAMPVRRGPDGPRRVDCLLFRRGDLHPYRTLRLWVPAARAGRSLAALARAPREAVGL